MVNKINRLILFSFILVGLAACGGSKKRGFERNPVDDMIRDMTAEPTFSIILYDMDVVGNFVKSYQHKYRIITQGQDSIPEATTTDWMEVPEEFFFAHENDMGMEIASKSADGTVSKTASPAGFTNYVGNPQYGHWVERDGNRFWEYYGKYRLLSDIFFYPRPIYYSGYNDYYTTYRGRRPYYGGVTSSGNPRFGTNSDHMRQSRPNFFQRRQSKNGFQRSTVSRSSRSSSSSSRSRTSRSSSRYSGSSSSRSRGGGFGK